MIVEIGHYALILSLVMAVAQSTIPFLAASRRDAALLNVAPRLAIACFALVATSFLALTYAYVSSDFSVVNVLANSHTSKPMIYKITGVWANHEGSMLLWVLIVALFGAMAAWFGGNLPPTLRARVLSVQAAIGVAFFAFILFTSNPFLRLAIASPFLTNVAMAAANAPPQSPITIFVLLPLMLPELPRRLATTNLI
mgnify:CR=1 FL=1